MKIVLAGGGTGGHFYPLVAIAEEINRIAEEEHLNHYKIYYLSTAPQDKRLLDEQFITFVPITAGKLRVYFSLQNIVDAFKTFFGIFSAIAKVYAIYPDVVISKGGYASFPVLVAARLLRIPVIIHESDTVPGRVNRWSGKFAQRVALSYPEAAEYFDPGKVSVTGQPVRHSVAHATKGDSGKEYFDLDPKLPTVGIFAGSLGAKTINDLIVDIIPELIKKYQVIHQTGAKHYEDVKINADIALGDDVRRTRYKIFPYLNDVQTKMFGGAADLVIGRAGSSIFEIAAWGKPSIIIPGRREIFHGDHQRKNAYHYARSGSCVVIEEKNLTSSILLNEIELILDHPDHYKTLAEHAKAFFKPDAARVIAAEAVRIALSHER